MHKELSKAGKLPPPSPVLEELKEIEANAEPRYRPASGSAALGNLGGIPAASGTAPVTAPPPLTRRNDFGRFLDVQQPQGLGVVLGIGRGDFAIQLLADWRSALGVYLVDPYIHIPSGYDDPANLQDSDHQKLHDEVQSRLRPFEGKYALIRDFSNSFAMAYRQGTNVPGAPVFIYIDANHAEEAITKDIELWWPLLARGGILAGSTYTDSNDGRIRVRTVVDRFIVHFRLQVYLTHDDVPPSWFVFKP